MFYAILQQGSLSFRAAGKLTFYFVVQAIYIPLELYRGSEVTYKLDKWRRLPITRFWPHGYFVVWESVFFQLNLSWVECL